MEPCDNCGHDHGTEPTAKRHPTEEREGWCQRCPECNGPTVVEAP